MRVIGKVIDTHHPEDEDDRGQSYESSTTYEVLSCTNCKDVTIRAGHWHELMDPTDYYTETLYPPKPTSFLGLPRDIRINYEKAQKVARVDSNAYAVLLGRVLDCVCMDRGAVGNTLNECLTDLANKGEIPKTLGDLAHQLRQLRNVGAHATLGTLSAREIPILEAICNAVLEYVYEAPRLLAEVQTTVNAVKGGGKGTPKKSP